MLRSHAIGMDDGAVFEQERGPGGAGLGFEVGVRGESTSPRDVAVTVGVEVVAGFGEGPGFVEEHFFENWPRC